MFAGSRPLDPIRAFTLVELLVSLTILVIVVILSLFAYRDMILKSHAPACLGNLKTLTHALLSHASENQREFMASFNGSSAWMSPLRSYMELSMGVSENSFRSIVHCRANANTSPWAKRPDGSMGMNYAIIHSPFNVGTVRPSSHSFHMGRVNRPGQMAMMADNFNLANSATQTPQAYGITASHVRGAITQAQNNPPMVQRLFPHEGSVQLSFFDGSVRKVFWKDLQPDWWSRIPQENPGWTPAPPLP
jgi:prepilin-type N-terminal cleavage/methylation domain-containing protein/prepilin-type processing-associated H-X9-DG protein